MKIQKQHIIPSLFFLLVIIIIGLWIGMDINDVKIHTTDVKSLNSSGVTFIPVSSLSCHGYLYPVETGGDVYLGEGCLNVTAVVSSGQVISWYKNGRKSGDDIVDASRIIHDARNFYVNPDEFLGFEGPWYVGTTDKVAFVVRDVTLDMISGSSGQNATSQITSAVSVTEAGEVDAGVLAIINSANNIDFTRVWVVLDEPSGNIRDPAVPLSTGDRIADREQQRDFYQNYTKPVVDYIRGRGYIVDYIGQAQPAIEVLAPPSFVQELVQQPTVKRIVVPKTSRPVIREMLQQTADQTLDVGIYLTSPPGIAPEPDTPRTEQQVREWYARNRVLYRIHTQPVLNLLNRENITTDYVGPYPMTALYGNIPVHLLEEFNTRSDIELIELNLSMQPL